MWDLPGPGTEQTHVSCIGRRILYHWATREVLAGTTQISQSPCTQELRGNYVSTLPQVDTKKSCTHEAGKGRERMGRTGCWARGLRGGSAAGGIWLRRGHSMQGVGRRVETVLSVQRPPRASYPRRRKEVQVGGANSREKQPVRADKVQKAQRWDSIKAAVKRLNKYITGTPLIHLH